MENTNKTAGVYFNEADIKTLIESHLDWAELKENQVFYTTGVMSENTPIGTSVIVGADGIRCDEGSNILTLVLSSGTYELKVETLSPNDELNIRFDRTVPITGTFGCVEDGVLDILTNAEKEFKKAVDAQLGNRDDEYANTFRQYNIRKIGGRGLTLLEKIKTEIKNEDILSAEEVTPLQLVSAFIELTEKYVNACENIKNLTERHDSLMADYKETFVDGSKHTKRLARDVEVVNKKIALSRQTSEFCLNIINAVIMPVLNMDVAC